MGKYKEIDIELQEKNFLMAILMLMILILLVLLICVALKIDYYKQELEKAVELRQHDLQTINYWIEENKEIKKQLDELQ